MWTCTYHIGMERRRGRKKKSKDKIVFFTYTYILCKHTQIQNARLFFTYTCILHKHTQIQNKQRPAPSSLREKWVQSFRSFASMLALSLDYQITPTLLFSTGTLPKRCHLFHLQVKWDAFITWHHSQSPHLSWQPFWFHGKFSRLTFSSVAEF